jgi:hypothetical protein
VSVDEIMLEQGHFDSDERFYWYIRFFFVYLISQI